MFKIGRAVGLRTKLTLVFIAVIFSAVTAFFIYYIVETNKKLSIITRDKQKQFITAQSLKALDTLITEDINVLKLLAQEIKKSSSDIAYCVFTDSEGKIIAHTFSGPVPEAVKKIVSAPKEGYQKIHLDSYGDIVHFSSPIETYGTISIGFPQATFLSLLKGEAWNFIAAYFIALVVAVAVSLFVSSRILNPLKSLTAGIKKVGSGNIDIELPVESSDEIGEISAVFNETLKKLKKYIQTEEEKQKMQENIVNFLNLLSSASEGDLTQRAEVTPDVFGSLGDAFNLMTEGLTELITEVKSTAEEVNSQSALILSLLQSMERDAEMQMVEVKKATEAVDNATASSLNITQKTNTAQDISVTALNAVGKGNKTIHEVIDGIQLIRVTIQAINKRMKHLSERHLEIITIAQLITEISNRTNMLAINASIEASRAGEQGKGFVVIADEIRSLAEKAAKSTKQIGEIINSIQAESGEVTRYLEEETGFVERETLLATEAGTAFKEIEEVIKDISAIISEINISAEGQKSLSSNVVVCMEEVQRKSLQMLKLVHDFSAISASLSSASKKLITHTKRFKIPGTMESVAV